MKVKCNGINYNVEIKGNGIPVVFLHGFSENLETFNELKLSECKCIYIDLIGHGKTDSPINIKKYKIDNLIKDLHFIISEIIKEKYILYGYSMGGRIALPYVLNYANEVEKLILESSSYGEEDDVKRKERRKSDYLLAKKIKEKGIQWFVYYWTNISIFNSQKLLDDKKREKIANIKLKNNINGLTRALMGFSQGRNPCLKNQVSKIKVKTLYISGELDSKYTSMGKEFEVLNKDVTRVVVKGAGHNIHMEKPLEVEKIIKKFIRMG